MKRIVFKNWVVCLLGIINFVALMIMSSECESLFMFFMSHLIALLVFVFNSMLILKFGKKELF